MSSFNLQLTTTLEEIIRVWIRQASETVDKNTIPEVKENKFMNALMELFSLFARHHEDIQDFDFIRIFQFFKDAGFARRLNSDTHIVQRIAKIEKQEQDKANEVEKKFDAQKD